MPAEGTWLARFVRTRLPLLYLLYALPMVIFLCVFMAPVQVADEFAHSQRADQISHGEIFSKRFGGTNDSGLVAFGALYSNMWFHPEVKQTVDLATRAGVIRWSGPQKDVNFQNTAQYGPFLYGPQVAGIIVGRALHLSVAQTLLLARIANGLLACLVAYIALSICQRGRALMFTALLLPMTLSQFGSASQDALLISLSLLVIAVASRILSERRGASMSEFLLFTAVTVATTMARPSQFALVLLGPVFLNRHDGASQLSSGDGASRNAAWRLKAIIAAVAVVASVIWFLVLAKLVPPTLPTWSPSRQFALLLTHPLWLPTVIINSFVSNGVWLFWTLVGHLGWTDTVMPKWFYALSIAPLVLALLAPGNRGAFLWPGALGLTTFFTVLVAICGALYLSWTPVGKETVDGMQGRYFLGILPLLAWPIGEYGPRLARFAELTWYPILVFPIVSLAVLPWVIMDRYYGSWPVMAEATRALLLP